MIEILANNQSRTIAQDSVAIKDSTEVIKMMKLVPGTKIKSEDGAIIPKQLLEWTELEPSFPSKKETDSILTSYIFTGVVVLVILISAKFILNKFKKRAK